jgi:cytidylate kinase
LTKEKGWILAGRDMTSVVFKDAEIKIFLTASLEARAQRRKKQHKIEENSEEVKKKMWERDKKDTERDNSPLLKTADA